MLEQSCNHSKQCRNNVATLCCAKSLHCESSRVTSPLEIGAAQFRFITEIARKALVLCVKRCHIRYGFRAVAKAIRYWVKIALKREFTVSKFIAVIPCRSICEMLVYFRGLNSKGLLKTRKGKSFSCIHVLHKT